MALRTHASSLATVGIRFAAAALLSAGVFAAIGTGCGGGGEEGPALSGSAASFDEQRAFADLRDQVAIGPRETGSAGNRRTVSLIARRLSRAGFRHVHVQEP